MGNLTQVKDYFLQYQKENPAYDAVLAQPCRVKTKKCRVVGCDQLEYNDVYCIQHLEEFKMVYREVSPECQRKISYLHSRKRICKSQRTSTSTKSTKSSKVQEQIEEIVKFAKDKMKQFPNGSVYGGRSSKDGAEGRLNCHLTRFNFKRADVEFHKFEVGDEKTSYFIEHEVVATLSDTIPREKLLNEAPGGFGGLSAHPEIPDFVASHFQIDFHSWHVPTVFTGYSNEKQIKITCPDLSPFNLPKFPTLLSHKDIARLLDYTTRRELYMKSGIKKVVCWQCGRKSTSVQNFNQHFYTVHKKEKCEKGGK